MIYAYIITLACVVMYLLGPVYAYDVSSGTSDHILYGLCHTGALHLSLNIYALWMFKPRGYTCLVAVPVSILASYLPWAVYDIPTCGLSAFLMACFARRYAAWGEDILPVLALQLMIFAIPGINAAVHIYSFITSYIIWHGIYTGSH